MHAAKRGRVRRALRDVPHMDTVVDELVARACLREIARSATS
jgi:hypothetical protein